MAVEDTIADFLKNSGSVPAILTLAGNRVYQDYIPQDAALPCVRFELLTRPSIKTLAGTAPGPRKATFRFDCLADKAADARALAHALTATEGKQTYSAFGATFVWFFKEDEQSLYSDPQQADERGVRHSLVDLTIWYTEP